MAQTWGENNILTQKVYPTHIQTRAYRKAGYLTMVIAGYIPANSQLAAAIATIVKSLSVGK